MAMASPRRIVIIGASGAGKSTLAERLAAALDVPFVELDALFWEPGWVEASDEVFGARIAEATAGERWVVAGNYSRFAPTLVWPRAERIVWLDLPLPVMLLRVARRIWRRWREHELLWGTNVERFWPQLKLWDPKASLIAYSLMTHRRRRRQSLTIMRDPILADRVIHLTSPREVEAFARSFETAAAGEA